MLNVLSEVIELLRGDRYQARRRLTRLKLDAYKSRPRISSTSQNLMIRVILVQDSLKGED